MRLPALPCCCLFLTCAARASPASQPDSPDRLSFRNSFSLSGEWSNTSSHIFLGIARRRRLGAFDLTLSHRVLDRHYFGWYTDLELQPLFFLEDPLAHDHFTFQRHYGHFPIYAHDSTAPLLERCHTFAATYTNPQRTYTSTYSRTCSTRWSYAGGLSPLGQRLQFLPRRRIQPYALVNPGFLASARDLPYPKTSSLNFTFDLGAGLAFFTSARRSVSIDYRFHHLSNAYLGSDPGVDNQVVHLTYTFGR